jgi:hypothetical protein
MNYYKIVSEFPKVGSVLNTTENINYARFVRFSKLKQLFDLIFKLSSDHNLPIYDVLKFTNQIEIINNGMGFYDQIEIIKEEISKTNFILSYEFRYFNDYILEKARKDIFKELKIELPNRFESQYFFQSIDDCIRYNNELTSKSNKIIEVEFNKIDAFFKGDNKFLINFDDYYTSEHFYNQAKSFLLESTTDNPLFEIVFIGNYKIIKHHLIEITRL